MEDDDLAEIRAKRMAELGMGGGGGAGGAGPGGAQSQQEAMQKQQEAKSMMLAQVKLHNHT